MSSEAAGRVSPDRRFLFPETLDNDHWFEDRLNGQVKHSGRVSSKCNFQRLIARCHVHWAIRARWHRVSPTGILRKRAEGRPLSEKIVFAELILAELVKTPPLIHQWFPFILLSALPPPEEAGHRVFARPRKLFVFSIEGKQ